MHHRHLGGNLILQTGWYCCFGSVLHTEF